MANYVTWGKQPVKKIGILKQKESELIHAIRNDFAEKKLFKAAEKVRQAKLGVLKGQMHCLEIYSVESDNKKRRRHLEQINQAYSKWTSMQLKDIIEIYSKAKQQAK